MRIDYFRPRTFIEQGDKIVVLGEESFDMDGVDGKFTNQWVQIYTIKDELIVRMEEFATSATSEDYGIVS